MSCHPSHPQVVPPQLRWEAEKRRGTPQLLNGQIAERLGIGPVSIGVERRELGLPPPLMPDWWQQQAP